MCACMTFHNKDAQRGEGLKHVNSARLALMQITVSMWSYWSLIPNMRLTRRLCRPENSFVIIVVVVDVVVVFATTKNTHTTARVSNTRKVNKTSPGA